jgi:peptidoglycan hydrolase CwlO-like protein
MKKLVAILLTITVIMTPLAADTHKKVKDMQEQIQVLEHEMYMMALYIQHLDEQIDQLENQIDDMQWSHDYGKDCYCAQK